MELNFGKAKKNSNFDSLKIWQHEGIPIKAPSGTNAPTHANSCALGTLDNGVSVRSLSLSFGETGDVHPIAVPTATLAILTELFFCSFFFVIIRLQKNN